MNDNEGSVDLDTLLARPALLSDRGFSERIALNTAPRGRARRKLFLTTGLCWLVAMLLAASPQAIYTDLVALSLSLDLGGLLSSLQSQVLSTMSMPQQLPLISLAVPLLSLAAVVSMALRA